METLVQVVTVALAVVAIIWHQQRTIDKLRDDTDRGFEKLRTEVASKECSRRSPTCCTTILSAAGAAMGP